MTETQIYEQIARYLNFKHPKVIYHFDLSGIHNPSPRTRGLYSRLNGRAFPDLFIAKSVFRTESVDVANGMFLEIKREGTRLTKRDGSWASPHIAEQAAMLEALAAQGYIAQLACGLDEALELIESYLS